MSKTKIDKEIKEESFIRELVTQMHCENRRERRWNLFFRFIRTLAFLVIAAAIFITASKPTAFSVWGEQEDKPHAALISIDGEIMPDSKSSAEKIIPAIHRAFSNKNAEIIVLKINSPGGSAVQAGLIFDEIIMQKKNYPSKRVYAVIEDIGASGGYYIAVAADRIYAHEASLVGSIGVITSSFGFSGLLEKLGIERRVITAGKNKDFLDPFLPMSEETKKFWENVLQDTHELFISRVKQSRGDKLNISDTDIFSGLIWNGLQAEKLGLIDGLDSIQNVVRQALGSNNIVDYSPKMDLLSRLGNRSPISILQEKINFDLPVLIH